MNRDIREVNKLFDPTSNWCCIGSGPDCMKWATCHMDIGNKASRGNWASRMKLSKTTKVAIWNVRGQLQTRKLDIIKKEIQSYSIIITIIIVGRNALEGKGYFTTNKGNTVYFSGGHESTSRNGVAVIVDKRHSRAVKEFIAVNDQIIMVTIESRQATQHQFILRRSGECARETTNNGFDTDSWGFQCQGRVHCRRQRHKKNC